MMGLPLKVITPVLRSDTSQAKYPQTKSWERFFSLGLGVGPVDRRFSAVAIGLSGQPCGGPAAILRRHTKRRFTPPGKSNSVQEFRCQTRLTTTRPSTRTMSG